MGAKREQILWDTVWELSEKLENVYSLRGLLSAGILLMSNLNADDRERAVGAAKNYGKSTAKVKFDLLSAAESAKLERLRKLLGPDDDFKSIVDSVGDMTIVQKAKILSAMGIETGVVADLKKTQLAASRIKARKGTDNHLSAEAGG